MTPPPQVWPQGNIWIKLIEVEIEMLHTKVKATPLQVSEKNYFEVGLLWSHLPICDPRGGASLDPRGIIWIELIEVHKETLNIKALPLPVSENFEVGIHYSYVPTCDPLGWAKFWPKGHHMNKLGKGQQGDAIYQISRPSSFKEEFWNFLSSFPCSTFWPPGQGILWINMVEVH